MPATKVNEKSIVGALRRLPKAKWRQVLRYIESLQPQKNGSRKKRWTAKELLKLPPEERAPILAEQAAALEHEYRTNPELTAFEAFGDEDLYVDHPDTETR